MNRTGLDHCLAGLGEPLVVAAVPPIPTDPGERPFDHPAAVQQHKPLRAGWALHHLDHIGGLRPFQPGIEAVIAANPQAIISTDDTVPDAAAEWSRWRHIEAVRSGNVYTLRSDDIARATTRLTVAAEAVCRTLDTARQRLQAR